jgi:D-glycero-D-manno-heptose 1,7-bisphosphate phosphatase
VDSKTGTPAVFLDRDGVLIENRENYVRTWEEVEIFEQAVEACRRLIAAGFTLVVITNQAVVGRGHLPKEYVLELNQRILDRFGQLGAPIPLSYICTHRPDEGCECRKPRPGNILKAAREHHLDLSRSFFVGDAMTDLEAAEAAGVEGILVRTGRGRTQEMLVLESGSKSWIVLDDLRSAAEAILSRSG